MVVEWCPLDVDFPREMYIVVEVAGFGNERDDQRHCWPVRYENLGY